MPIAAFTFGDATLTIVELAFMFLWIWIAVGVVFDIFRSQDLSNWGKALWVLEPRTKRDTKRSASTRGGAPSGSSADDVNKLAELRDRGVLTSEEFERAKAKALA